MNIEDFSFNIEQLGGNNFHSYWLVIITNNLTKDKFGVKCRTNAGEQPSNQAIFNNFCDKRIFREQFFIDIDLENSQPETNPETKIDSQENLSDDTIIDNTIKNENGNTSTQ